MRQAAAALLLLASMAASANEVAVVVAANLGVGALTPAQVSDIYLGRVSRFPDGTVATPCDLAADSPTRAAFYERVLGKTSAQVKAHWSKMVFTGRGQPPREVLNDEEAKKLVAGQPGMVCYIDKRRVDSQVKVVLER